MASFWETPAAAGVVAGVVGAALNQLFGLAAEQFKARSNLGVKTEEIRFTKFHDKLMTGAEECYTALSNLIDKVGKMTAPLKSTTADLNAEYQDVIQRFEAFTAAYYKVAIYLPTDMRATLSQIQSLVVATANKYRLTLNPQLNNPGLWSAIDHNVEEIKGRRETLAIEFHRMLESLPKPKLTIRMQLAAWNDAMRRFIETPL